MDDQQTLPNHGDPCGESPSPQVQPSGERRRGALSFVIVFLVVTIILLVLGRYAVNTRFLNWYLFQVAGHTSWVLDVIGYSSGLEDPAMYRDRAAAVRAELEARRRSEDAPVRPEHEFDSAPLEPYEIWQYRSLLLARQLAHTEEMAALTAPRETPVLDSDEDRIAYLRESLNRLTKSTYFPGAGGTVHVMAAELGPLLEASEETVSALERGQRPEGVSLGSVLEQLDRQIAAGLDQQHAYLESRAIQLSLQIHDRHGPTVDFIARAGLTTQLRDAEASLRSVQQNSEISETIREQRIDTQRSNVESLKKARETAAENRDAEADQDRRFRFNVVPDCGALPSMSIFLAAMIAFPTELWRRLLGLLIGLPLLYAINIARLTCLALIGAYTGNGQIFEFAHEYVWQAVYIVFVVIIWLMWVEFIVRPKTNRMKTPSPALPVNGEGAGSSHLPLNGGPFGSSQDPVNRENAESSNDSPYREADSSARNPENGAKDGSPPVHGGS